MVITLDFESSDPGSSPGRTSVLPVGEPDPDCNRLGALSPPCQPPWLSWQSARLLTDRSLVRAQVEAHYLLPSYSEFRHRSGSNVDTADPRLFDPAVGRAKSSEFDSLRRQPTSPQRPPSGIPDPHGFDSLHLLPIEDLRP